MSEDDDQIGAAIACYLIQQGAQLTRKNHQNKSPLDVSCNAKTEEAVKQYASTQ